MDGAEHLETERLMTVAELAERTRLSVGTIHHWIAAGKVPVVRFGSRVLFIPSEIDGWVREHHCPARIAAKKPVRREADMFRDGGGK